MFVTLLWIEYNLILDIEDCLEEELSLLFCLLVSRGTLPQHKWEHESTSVLVVYLPAVHTDTDGSLADEASEELFWGQEACLDLFLKVMLVGCQDLLHFVYNVFITNFVTSILSDLKVLIFFVLCSFVVHNVDCVIELRLNKGLCEIFYKIINYEIL